MEIGKITCLLVSEISQSNTKKKPIVKLSDSYSSSPDDFTSKAIKQTKKIFQKVREEQEALSGNTNFTTVISNCISSPSRQVSFKQRLWSLHPLQLFDISL